MSERQESPAIVDARTGMAIMDLSECVALLEATPIGRIVFIDGEGQPVALPVNFRWYEDSVVFRTLEGQKLLAAVTNQRVSFEVDEWAPDSRKGASVLVKGQAVKVDPWADRERLEQLGLLPWADQKWRPVWVRIEPAEITGRRLS